MIPRKTNFTVLIVEYVDKEAEIILLIVIHATLVYLIKDLTITNAWKMLFAKNAQYVSKINSIQLSPQFSSNADILCIDSALLIFHNTNISVHSAIKAFVTWLSKKKTLIWKLN
jgi:hypothetical protein